MYPADQSITSLERRETIVNGWGAACSADEDVNDTKASNLPFQGRKRLIVRDTMDRIERNEKEN